MTLITQADPAAVTSAPIPALPVTRARPWWLSLVRGLLAIVLSLGIGALAFWLFTRNNDFPVWYHPDETSKAQQILDPSHDRNFNHPLLLLEAAQWYTDRYQLNNDVKQAVFAGREVSAALAAAGVVAIALAGFHWAGFIGLLICGLGVALCPPMLVYAHYFKEDTALLGGIMLAMLGARLTVGAKRWWMQPLACAALGVGCAAAASGKYVGAAAVAPCLLAVVIARAPGGLRHWAWIMPIRVLIFAAVTAIALVAINNRMFVEGSWPPEFVPEASFKIEGEFEHATQQHSQMALAKPNHFCTSVALHEVMWHQWLLMALGVGVWIWELFRFRGVGSFSRWGIVLGAFLICFAVVLTFNVIPFNRYALPITLSLYLIAASFGVKLVNDVWRANRWAGMGAFAACLALIVVLQGGRCLNFNRQFLDDSRDRLRDWIADHIPSGVMVADNYTHLTTPGDPYRRPNQKNPRVAITRNSMYACDSAATVADLADQGVDYVAVSWMTYNRFFVDQIGGAPGYEQTYDRRRKFYEDLFEKGELLYRDAPEPPTGSFTNPEVRVYRITNLSSQPKSVRQNRGVIRSLFGG